jgi:hypothetical protein
MPQRATLLDSLFRAYSTHRYRKKAAQNIEMPATIRIHPGTSLYYLVVLASIYSKSQRPLPSQ